MGYPILVRRYLHIESEPWSTYGLRKIQIFTFNDMAKACIIFELSFEVVTFVLIKHHDIRIPRMLRTIYTTCLHNHEGYLANMASTDEEIMEGLKVLSGNHLSLSTMIISKSKSKSKCLLAQQCGTCLTNIHKYNRNTHTQTQKGEKTKKIIVQEIQTYAW